MKLKRKSHMIRSSIVFCAVVNFFFSDDASKSSQSQKPPQEEDYTASFDEG